MTSHAAQYPRKFGTYALLGPLSPASDPRPVFLAGIAGSERPWALKVLGSGPDAPPFDAVKAEAKVLARLSNPLLPNVLDSALVENAAVLIMGFVPGRALADLLSRVGAGGSDELLSPDLSALIVQDLVRALLALHRFENAGTSHGNVSTRTVMVSQTGEVRLVGYRPGRSFAARPPDGLADDLRAAGRVAADLQALSSGREAATASPSGPLTALADPRTGAADLKTVAMELSEAPSLPGREKLGRLITRLFGADLEQESAKRTSLLRSGEELLAVPAAKGAADEYPKPGAVIGPYRIIRAIGEGGMGRVLEACDEQSGKRVAIKVLHPRRRTPAIEERLRREAAAVARIANDHVVKIERFGDAEDGKLLYLAMEFLEGRTLDQVVQTEGPLEPKRALRIGLQLARGVAAAHAAGVIHRDLKPGNIILMGQGDTERATILDFGLARMEMPDEKALTQAGDLVGTFVYAAPEQAQGRPATPSFDIYALGELLYEMLSRTLPHVAQDTHDILKRKITEEPTPLSQHRPDLPAGIESVVMRALARLPERRHRSAEELAQDLQRLVEGAGAAWSARTKRRRRAGVVASLFLGTAVAGIMLARARPKPIGSRREEPVTSAVVAGAISRSLPPAVATAPIVPPPVLAPAATPVQNNSRRQAVNDAPLAGRRTVAPATQAVSAPLRAAERAFEAGNTIEAIQLATDALDKGAGLAAHLALGKYYTKMRLGSEALKHYKAVLAAEPENDLAAAGVATIEAARHSR